MYVSASSFQVTNPGLTHGQYYTIALTALYLYDYLLTFADEVFSYRTTQAGEHCD